MTAPAFLRSAVKSVASAATTGSTTVSVVINAGETALMLFGSGGGTGDNARVTSVTGGGTWTKQTSSAYAPGGVVEHQSEIWATGAGAATAATVVTVAWAKGSASGAVELIVLAYSGVDSFGATATGTNSTATTTPTQAITTTQADSTVVAAFDNCNVSAGFTYTARTGFGTIRAQTTDGGASGADVSLAGVELTSATATGITLGVTQSSQLSAHCALELKSAAAVGGSNLSGSLALPLGLSGATAVAVQASGTLALPLGLSGSVAHPVAVGGSLPLPLGLSGAAAVAVQVSGALALPLGASGALADPVAVAGTLPLPFAAAGSVVVAVQASGTLALPLGLSGAIADPVQVSGTLALPLGVAGSVTHPVQASGSLPLPFGLSGSLSTTGGRSVTGTLALPLGLSGAAAVAVQAAGVLPLPFGLSGGVAHPVAANGVLPLPFGLSGAVTSGSGAAPAAPVSIRAFARRALDRRRGRFGAHGTVAGGGGGGAAVSAHVPAQSYRTAGAVAQVRVTFGAMEWALPDGSGTTRAGMTVVGSLLKGRVIATNAGGDVLYGVDTVVQFSDGTYAALSASPSLGASAEFSLTGALATMVGAGALPVVSATCQGDVGAAVTSPSEKLIVEPKCLTSDQPAVLFDTSHISYRAYPGAPAPVLVTTQAELDAALAAPKWGSTVVLSATAAAAGAFSRTAATTIPAPTAAAGQPAGLGYFTVMLSDFDGLGDPTAPLTKVQARRNRGLEIAPSAVQLVALTIAEGAQRVRVLGLPITMAQPTTAWTTFAMSRIGRDEGSTPLPNNIATTALATDIRFEKCSWVGAWDTFVDTGTNQVPDVRTALEFGGNEIIVARSRFAGVGSANKDTAHWRSFICPGGFAVVETGHEGVVSEGFGIGGGRSPSATYQPNGGFVANCAFQKGVHTRQQDATDGTRVRITKNHAEFKNARRSWAVCCYFDYQPLGDGGQSLSLVTKTTVYSQLFSGFTPGTLYTTDPSQTTHDILWDRLLIDRSLGVAETHAQQRASTDDVVGTGATYRVTLRDVLCIRPLVDPGGSATFKFTASRPSEVGSAGAHDLTFVRITALQHASSTPFDVAFLGSEYTTPLEHEVFSNVTWRSCILHRTGGGSTIRGQDTSAGFGDPALARYMGAGLDFGGHVIIGDSASFYATHGGSMFFPATVAEVFGGVDPRGSTTLSAYTPTGSYAGIGADPALLARSTTVALALAAA